MNFYSISIGSVRYPVNGFIGCRYNNKAAIAASLYAVRFGAVYATPLIRASISASKSSLAE